MCAVSVSPGVPGRPEQSGMLCTGVERLPEFCPHVQLYAVPISRVSAGIARAGPNWSPDAAR